MVGVNTPQVLPTHIFVEENGALLVLQDGSLPFQLKRVFAVRAGAKSVRGQHAHRSDSQFLVAVTGSVHVITTSHTGETQTFLLDDWHHGLYLPPLVWAEQRYLSQENVLLVACAEAFDPNDYIRDPAEFEQLTGVQISSIG